MVSFGERLFLKAYRRLQTGENPEAEIGRFLTEVVRFPRCVPVAGTIDHVDGGGRVTTLALLQAYVEHQGDAWRYTLDYLDRELERESAVGTRGRAAEVHGGYLALIRTLGVRTAELHAALSRRTGNPSFDPEPISMPDIAEWVHRARSEADAVFARLTDRMTSLPETVRASAQRVLDARGAIVGQIDAHTNDKTAGTKVRVHGDYHLGQALVAKNDFVIVDFEGEPSRPLAERRKKQSTLKDVAGMLRSFDYAMHTALDRASRARPEHDAVLRELGREWQDVTRRAYLDGYEEVARSAGLASPREEATRLLQLFLIEKACYELDYELDNRPTWVAVPLAGLAAMTSAAA